MEGESREDKSFPRVLCCGTPIANVICIELWKNKYKTQKQAIRKKYKNYCIIYPVITNKTNLQ